MKITDTGNISPAIPQKPEKKSLSVSKDFEQELDKNIEKLSAGTIRAENAQPLAVNKTSPPLFPSPIDRDEVVSRAAKLLDTMEEYARQLSSPRATLKEIDPLMAKIDTEKNELQRLSQSLASTDELKSILDEALLRSSVEVIKFNRGDYV